MSRGLLNRNLFLNFYEIIIRIKLKFDLEFCSICVNFATGNSKSGNIFLGSIISKYEIISQ